MPPLSTYKNDPPILKQVVETIDKHAMFTSGDSVLVGVSGGPDSVALLQLLNGLAPGYKLQLAVAHLDHGLRPNVDQQETEYVEQLANDLGLPFHLKQAQLDPSQGSLEEQAREVRYRFFNSMAAKHGYTKIALGHQADDDAESVLLHLFRGSGLRGLCGIVPVRDERIVRPLIDLRRSDILAYLKRCGIQYMTDASNADLRFDRNRVRHKLLPLLQQDYNANIVETLHRMAGLCRDEDGWIDQHLRPLQAQIETASTPQRLTLDLELLWKQPRPVQRRLIRSALRQWRGHLKRITALHVEKIISLSSPDRSEGRLNLPDGLAAERSSNRLRFSLLDNPRRFPAAHDRSFQHTIASIKKMPTQITIPEANACMTFAITTPPNPKAYMAPDNLTAWFDPARLDFPLFVRNVLPGDRIAPLGTQGRKKLKKLFIDCNVPRTQRSRTPILASGETVYWVAGLRRSSAALISESTSQALRVTCEKLAH